MEYIPLINSNGAYNAIHVGLLPWVNEEIFMLAYEHIVRDWARPGSDKWFGEPSTPLADEREWSNIQVQC